MWPSSPAWLYVVTVTLFILFTYLLIVVMVMGVVVLVIIVVVLVVFAEGKILVVVEGVVVMRWCGIGEGCFVVMGVGAGDCFRPIVVNASMATQARQHGYEAVENLGGGGRGCLGGVIVKREKEATTESL